MNQREKILAITIGVVLVLGAGMGLRSAYRSKLSALDASIGNYTKKVNDLKADAAAADRAIQHWREIGQQTFSMDEKDVKTLLRSELVNLAKRVGMPSVTPDLGRVTGWGKHRVKVLNCSFDGEGTIENVKKFLFELSRQPYLVRCWDLKLSPVMTKPKGSRGSAVVAESTGRFTLKTKLQTLILPSHREIPKITPVQLEGSVEPVERTMLASIDNYGMIRRELFEAYKPPPPPPPVRKDPPKPVPQPTTTVKRPPPPPPPPKDQDMVVRGILSSPRGQQVILVADQRNPAAPETRVEVGEELYGGRLIYVHPTGCVSEREDGTRRFHPVGLQLKQGKILNASEHPLILYELTKLEEHLAGISEAR